MWIPQNIGGPRLFFLGTANTGLVVNFQISKNGNPFANSDTGVTTLTELADGWYAFTLNANDANSLGHLYYKLTGVTLGNDAQLCDDVVPMQAGLVETYTRGMASNVIGATQLADGGLQATKFGGGFIDSGSFTGAALIALSAGGQLAESYAANGVAPTSGQALMMILALLSNISITGTTLTVKGLDGTTTRMTFALNDATNPTSRTRAT